MTLTDSIKQEATALGFDTVGISHVPPADSAPLPLLDRLREWLHHGYGGAMILDVFCPAVGPSSLSG
jgi:epoxyqueuosine reductase QueG